MPQPVPPEREATGTPFSLRLLQALGDVVAPRSSSPSGFDLIGEFNDAERKVKENWPEAKPSGDGAPYLDQILRILVRRLRWRVGIAVGGELAWLLGRVAALVIIIGVAWQHLFG